MTIFFDRSWFDKVTFNMREMQPPRIGVHLWKRGYNCTLARVTEDEIIGGKLWLILHERGYDKFLAGGPVNEQTCPQCGSLIRLCRREWEGHGFCGTCGGSL